MEKSIFSPFRTAFPGVTFREGNLCFKRHLLVVILMLCSMGVWGQIDVKYSSFTSITCPITPVATISTPPSGLTFSQFSRGSGVTCSAANGSISGSGFNTTLATNITSQKWYTFSIIANATTTFTLNNLKIVSRVSTAAGTPNVSVQYSIGAGTKTVVGSYTPTTTATTYTIIPATVISVAAGEVLNIFIIPNSLNASGTTCRVEDNTSINVTASAAGKSSNGTGGGDWNTAGTWSPSGVPTSTDNVKILGNDIVTTAGAITRSANTTIDANGTLAVGATFTNDGTTSVNGTFQINNNGFGGGAGTFIYSGAGNLIFNHSGNNVYGPIDAGHKYWPATNSPVNVTVNTSSPINLGVSRAVGGTFQTAAGVSFVGQTLTLNGIAQINFDGYFSQAPLYGSSSKLIYRTGAVYNRGLEWSANAVGVGYPNEVQISGNTTINYPSTGSGAFSQPLGIEKNLTIDVGSSIFMGYGDNGNKSGSLTIGGNLVNNGNFGLGNAIGGDFTLRGNWTNTGNFYPNNRAVFFNGTTNQTITGATTFDYLTLNNAAGVSLANSIVNNFTLDLQNGKLTLGANNLTIGNGGTISNATAAKYVVTNGTGQLKRTVGASNVLFPIGPSATNYNPITTTNTGTSDVYGFRVAQGVGNAPDINVMVNNSWFVSEVMAGGGNLRVVPQWNTSDEGSNFSAIPTDNFIELYSPVMTSYPATVTGQTASLTNAGDHFSNSLTGTTYFAVAVHSAPVITSALTANAYQSVPFNYQITATNSPTSFNATSLPTGLSIDTATGIISGTTSVATGNYNVTISATNARGTDTKTLVITVGAGPCLSQENFTSTPTDWAATNITYSSNEAVFGANTGVLSTVVLSNPATLTFDLRRTNNSTVKSLIIEISTTTQGGSYTTIATFDHSNTTESATTSLTVDLSAYSSYSTVYVRFRKASSTTSPWYLKNVKVFCGPSTTVTQPTDYFRSNGSGDWTAVTSWQSSSDLGVNWINADLYPGSAAGQVNIAVGNKVVISSANVTVTNTYVFGTLEVTTAGSYKIDGDDDIELTVEGGGVFLVNSPGEFLNPGGLSYGLIKTGGKVIAGTNMGSGSSFVNSYIGYLYGLFYFANAGICEWANTTTTLGSSTPEDSEYLYPYSVGDIPIFRVTATPAHEFGSNININIFHGILEIISPASFTIGKSGAKSFLYGVRGSGTLIQNSTSGKLILGDSTIIPEIGGSVTLNVLTAGLQLPNGANVPTNANAKITSSLENNSINRQGGNLTVDGILDITNMRITNPVSGGIIVNGTLRTANTGGLYGGGSAVVGNTLTLNPNSTIDYYATANQTISTGKNYYNITFSGAGIKSYSGTINVDNNGLVKITGTTIVDAASNLASTSANNTAFTMDGGRLILRTTGTQPNMSGIYNLTGGVVEFASSQLTAQTVRPNFYQNIEVTGNNVGNGSGNIKLNTNGTFKVKTNGIFTINDDTITSLDNSPSVTVENNGTFKTGTTEGFSGYTITYFPTKSSAINSTITNINLLDGSTVEYSRNGDQPITKSPLTTPTDANYQNLKISGTGIKTATGTTIVKKVTYVEAGELVVSSTLDTELPNEFHADNGVEVNAAATFRLGNNANLLQSNTSPAINTGNTIAERIAKLKFVSIATQADYNYWSSPVVGQKLLFNLGTPGNSFSPGTPNNRIYQYQETTDYFVPTSDANFVAGKGYAIRAESKANGSTYQADGSAKTFTFTGKPNNGDISTPSLNYSGPTKGYNLIGNPYPSNISFNEFYSVNSTKIDQKVYFWTNAFYTATQGGSGYSGNNYATYNGTGGVNATGGTLVPTEFIKPGQGFIIQVKSPGTLDFTNNMRFSGVSPFFNNRNNTEKSRFWLRLTSPTDIVNSLLIGYIPGATNGFDPNFDASLLSDTSDEFYSVLGTEKLIIQGREEAFVNTDVIPLGTKHFVSGTYKIALENKEGIFSSQNIYLKDKKLNIITNLSEGEYVFDVVPGIVDNRFEIVYKPETILGTDTNSLDNLQVYRNGETFIIQSSAKKITEVEIYDSSGRLYRKLLTNTLRVDLEASDISSGMYILKIKMIDETVRKKIIK